MPFPKILLAAALLAGLSAPVLAAPQPAAGTAWTDPGSGMGFVWIPAGEFQMGCQPGTANCSENEGPAHHRVIGGFWLGRTEVTRVQWHKFMDHDPSVAPKGDDYPVDQVTWDDAQAFLAKLNQGGHGHFRLPSEAEWEYACRGGDASTLYCGGNDANAVGWYLMNAKRSSQPVAQKAANAYGLYDMSGNLWEWTEDCWAENHVGAPSDARPRKDDACLARVLKGGSWGTYPALMRATARRNDSDVKCPFIGLRIVRDAAP